MAILTTTRRPAWVRVFTPGPGRIRLPWIPVSIMSALVFCAVFAQWVTPYDPTQIAMLEAKIAPVPFGENWTWSHPLGTDIMGRDMLSRLIHGARTAVLISLVALGTGPVCVLHSPSYGQSPGFQLRSQRWWPLRVRPD